jgi:CDP-diacylglycerol--glycerol-3-phosphate 3-phosphatidyltransferase
MALERLKRKRKKRPPTDLARESRYLPNILTMGRIAMIPLILVFVDNYSPLSSFIACLIYLAASITDFVDGWLARRRKQVSILGKFLDPLADKLMVTSVLVYLTAMDRVPAWVVVALLARELSVTGLRSIAVSEGLVISASDKGKQKTALQMVATMFLLIHFRYRVWGLEQVTWMDEPLVINFHAIGMVTLYLALAMAVLSAADYLLAFARAVKQASGGRSDEKPHEKLPEKLPEKAPEKTESAPEKSKGPQA